MSDPKPIIARAWPDVLTDVHPTVRRATLDSEGGADLTVTGGSVDLLDTESGLFVALRRATPESPAHVCVWPRGMGSCLTVRVEVLDDEHIELTITSNQDNTRTIRMPHRSGARR